MPSYVIGYVPGSGFTPLVSGNPWSGRIVPTGILQIRADPNNSGALYVSLSGGNFHSGQMSTLVASGGPTINSGALGVGVSSGGQMDGMKLMPGDAMGIPVMALQNTGPSSGTFRVCFGADPTCSGPYGRIYAEMF